MEECGRFRYLYSMPHLWRVVLEVPGDEDGPGAMSHFEKGGVIHVW